MTGPRDGRDDTITAIRGHVSYLGTAPIGVERQQVIPPEPGELP
jgi:hypothetical protein